MCAQIQAVLYLVDPVDRNVLHTGGSSAYTHPFLRPPLYSARHDSSLGLRSGLSIHLTDL